MTNKARRLVIVSGGILLLGANSSVEGGRPFRHACAPNRGGVCKTPYGTYESLDLVSRTSIMLVAPSTGSLPDATIAGNGDSTRFFGDTTSIETSGLRLDRIGASLASDGRAEVTGRLTFDGGPHDALAGGHAVIRVRGFAGTPQQPGALFGATLLFDTSRRVWVGKDDMKLVSLLAPPGFTWREANLPVSVDTSPPAGNAGFSEVIGSQFSRITHLEVVLELGAAR